MAAASRFIVLVLGLHAAQACGTHPGPPPPTSGNGHPLHQGGGGGGSAGGASNTAAESTSCIGTAAAAALTPTITGLVTFLNTLPRPLSIPCFLEALPRPLAVNATSSTQSIQPAASATAPRLFLNYGNLVIAASAQGAGLMSVELGELDASGSALTGNIDFPLQNTLAEAAVYSSLVNTNGVNACQHCHGAPSAEVSGGITRIRMKAFQPRAATEVPLTTLEGVAASCNDGSFNCGLLRSVFRSGDSTPEAYAFPGVVPFF